MAYIDTSVLAAYYCPERLSGKIQKKLAGLDEAVISPLVQLELSSAVSQKIRGKELTIADGNRILSLLQVHLADGLYRVVAIGSREYALARGWVAAFSTPLRTLDALHLAAAFANDLTLLTADQALSKSAKQLGVSCQRIA
jgi:predicted nucleic acid-binding protein